MPIAYLSRKPAGNVKFVETGTLAMVVAAIGGSQAFQAFTTFIRNNTTKLRVRPPRVPVLYAGYERGCAVWKRIEIKQASWAKRNRAAGKFTMITDILFEMKSPIPGYRNMLDFANNASNNGRDLAPDEQQDVWDLLSALWAQQNAKSVFVWKGETLQKNPVLTAIELPILLYSKKISDKKSELVRKILSNQRVLEDEMTAIDKEFKTELEKLSKSVAERKIKMRVYQLNCSLQKMSS